MKKFYYILYNLFYKPILKLYLKSDSTVTFDGFQLKVYKEVFHPKLFFSTKYFYSFLKKQNLEKQNFLEIGCGSGIQSLLAFRKGAKVTVVDIDTKAVENTALNFKLNFPNQSNVNIIQSDVFKSVPVQQFDVIAINPPYYFKKVEHNRQYAWYCGEHGEYFESLFSNLPAYIHNTSRVFMILEENCEIDRIQAMALKNKIHFTLVEEKLIRWEKSYIYRISSF